MQLSAHFTLEEMLRSDEAERRGIINTPTDEALDALHATAAGLERVRTVLGNVRLFVSSGYRCPKLNTATRGSRTSQHMKGEAADFRAPDFGTPRDICFEIMANADFICFDQLIWEGASASGGSWVHISFSDNPRCEVLTAAFVHGEAHYSRGISNAF